MRHIKYIAIHCTAGFGSVPAICRYWRHKLGWRNPGYHYIIDVDGKVSPLLPIDEISNGVKGFNEETVNIAYIGGVDPHDYSKAMDTRTPAQKAAMLDVIYKVLEELKQHQSLDGLIIQGHRDFSPDQNGNGKIEAWERIKECPSFDAREEYNWIAS